MSTYVNPGPRRLIFSALDSDLCHCLQVGLLCCLPWTHLVAAISIFREKPWMTFVSDTVFLSVPDWMSGQTLTLQGVFFLWSALMSTSYFVLSWNSFLPDGFHEQYMYFMYCSSSMFPVHPVWILGEQAISSPWLCLSGVSLQPSNQFCDHLFLNDDFILFSFFLILDTQNVWVSSFLLIC